MPQATPTATSVPEATPDRYHCARSQRLLPPRSQPDGHLRRQATPTPLLPLRPSRHQPRQSQRLPPPQSQRLPLRSQRSQPRRLRPRHRPHPPLQLSRSQQATADRNPRRLPPPATANTAGYVHATAHAATAYRHSPQGYRLPSRNVSNWDDRTEPLPPPATNHSPPQATRRLPESTPTATTTPTPEPTPEPTPTPTGLVPSFSLAISGVSFQEGEEITETTLITLPEAEGGDGRPVLQPDAGPARGADLRPGDPHNFRHAN